LDIDLIKLLGRKVFLSILLQNTALQKKGENIRVDM
jgi:hypothetical protein